MKKGTKHSAEARAKMSRSNAARWQEPDFRARMLPHVRALNPKGAGRPKGSKNSPEAIEKTRQATIQRWQDPEYRARMLPHLMAVGPKGLAAARKARVKRPPRGTPEFRWYEKVRETLGPEAARSIQW
jgi:hypothetical protein